VAATVARTDGAIGYVELIYARKNKISYGSVRNKAGKDVSATMEAVSASAANLKDAAEDLRISLTDADGEAAYPISGLTWILVYENQKDAAKGQALVDFLWWVTHDGQKLAAHEDYAPLPTGLLPLVEKKLTNIKADGKLLQPKK
jgi:phosphate transport system substrate-binding protein